MGMVAVADVIAELNDLLEPDRFEDYGPNGLQVPGPARARTVATGVSASVELFERAAAERADLLVVHHGLFWRGVGQGPIDAQLKRRLQLLFDGEIALAAYHLPLDAHPKLGNNALLAAALGAERLDDPFAIHHGEPIGCLASFPTEGNENADANADADENANADADGDAHRGLTVEELAARVRTATDGRDPLIFDAGPPRIRRLAIVSGGGSDYLAEAAHAGAEVFITGEPTERVMAQARELGIHYVAAGHYATETFGVRALGEHLAERFGVRHVFLDVPNPI